MSKDEVVKKDGESELKIAQPDVAAEVPAEKPAEVVAIDPDKVTAVVVVSLHANGKVDAQAQGVDQLDAMRLLKRFIRETGLD